MAKKRMFSLAVLETDAFMDLPLSTQALYFHLNLRADDDGFIGNPKRITTNIGASLDDLKLLIAKRFVIAFDDGVIVIKHWRMHNAIKKDRYTQTNFTDDLNLLGIKDNGSYTIAEHEWNTDGEQMLQTSSSDKVRLDIGKSKDSIGKVNTNNHICHPDVTEVKAYIIEKGYHFSAEEFVAFYESNGWKVGKNPMKSWKAACVTWESNYKKKQPNQGKSWLEVAADLERKIGDER